MTTLSTISKFFLAITFVTAGLAGTADAKPESQRRILRPAYQASNLVAANRAVEARPAKAAKKKAKADRKARKAERRAEFDLNKDGELSSEERTSMHKQRFAEMDSNSDGGITLSEMESAKKHRREARMQERGISPDQLKKWQDKAAEKQHAQPAKRFAKLDADDNGTITWSEFEAGKGKHKGHHQGDRRRGYKKRSDQD